MHKIILHSTEHSDISNIIKRGSIPTSIQALLDTTQLRKLPSTVVITEASNHRY